MMHLKLIVSDFHLGRGKFLPDGSRNPLEDFQYDDKFAEFLSHYSSGLYENAEVELICNGDFFNHLQVDPNDSSPDIIDEKAAVLRTKEILQGHPELFSSMRRFAEMPNHSISFVLGNHDPGLLFPAVHQQLWESISAKVQVHLGPYQFDGVHVEHGNQYFADNAYNTKIYFLTRDLPRPIVNLPWGSYFVIHFMNRIKNERPYFDKIYPFKYYVRWALIHDTFFAASFIARMIFYFCWLRFRRDPHRRSSLIRTLKIIKELPLSPNLHREAKKILLSEDSIHTVVFGHTHHAVIREFAPGKTYINTGLWNEQVSLEISDPGKIVRLTYAHLEYNSEGRIQPSLKEWKGSHRMIEEL